MIFVKHFETKQKHSKVNVNEVAETKMTLTAILYIFVAGRIVVLYSEAYFCSQLAYELNIGKNNGQYVSLYICEDPQDVQHEK